MMTISHGRSDRRVRALSAQEVLDSRGWPTVQVRVTLEDGTKSLASVPSGASTGHFEAHERRDGDRKRYDGRGVLNACAAVEDEISTVVCGLDAADQPAIDQAMRMLDGTPQKTRLGANAILGVSMAVARAAAASLDLPLYAHLGGVTARRLPVPMMNVINGGKHASNRLEMQEFMIAPHGAPSYGEALRWGAETYHVLRTLLADAGFSTGVGDEGGFAPDLASDRDALSFIVRAIEAAGYRPGEDIAIMLDPAATSFQDGELYRLPSLSAEPLTREQLLAVYQDWAGAFPIVSIEDGFGEADWEGFALQTAQMGGRIQIVGDDIFVTNTKFIQRGIDQHCATASLIKPNQIGTVTETTEAVELCRRAGFAYKFSHRSGETCDSFVADFAVAMGGGQLKSGAPCRGERLAKYNRLLDIETELGGRAEFFSPFTRR